MAVRIQPINPYTDALLPDVERLALEGLAPLAIARRLGADARAVQRRIAILREQGRLPHDWRPSE